jgi:hypothetical protein
MKIQGTKQSKQNEIVNCDQMPKIKPPTGRKEKEDGGVDGSGSHKCWSNGHSLYRMINVH